MKLWLPPLVAMAHIGVSHSLDMDRRLGRDLSSPINSLPLSRLHVARPLRATTTNGIIATISALDINLIFVLTRHLNLPFGLHCQLSRLCRLIISSVVPRSSFHFCDIIREIEDDLYRCLVRIFVVEMINILFDLEAIVRNRLTSLAKRLFHE